MSKDLRKIVELATKPKRAAPKAKYIDPIVQSTFNQDGTLQEIVKTLSIRLRDPNTTVAFKSLITLHTILRSGSLDSVYPYLSTSSLSLSLSSHQAPNIAAYGHYLSSRLKSYSNLKRDVIRDKSDRRASKDRLRNLKVEQELLRETREIQRMISACVESKFYTDDVDDDVSMTALRLLTKDLLVLFTCVNEGMINILEHYFEMSHTDATTALKIYKTFCRDTEKVVGYLGIAKKLYNVLNVPIPNLKHAPVSLAGSLEEYLNDPNFEKNRQEYRENKRVVDGGQPSSTSTSKPTTTPSSSSTSATPSTSKDQPSTSTSSATPAPGAGAAAPAKSFTDFFESIEQSQTSMFPSSPSFNGTLSSQYTGNPFGMGMSGGQQAFGAFPGGGGGGIQPQFTGFQPSGVAPNPFLQPQFTGFAPQQPQMTGFAQPQRQLQPQMTGFVQPQMTGMNPFRQSMMPTGAGGGGGGNPFGMGMGMVQPQMTGNPFQSQQPQQPQSQPFLQAQNTGFGNAFSSGGGGPGGMRPMSMIPQPTGGNPFSQSQPQQQNSSLSPSYSTSALPSTSTSTSPSPFSTSSPLPTSANPTTSAPLVAQKTGARNPFASAPGTIIQQTIQEEPKGPSMNEIAYSNYTQQFQPQSQSQPQMNGTVEQKKQESKPQDAFSKFLEAQKTGTIPQPLTSQKTGGLFASVASDFTFDHRGNSTSSSENPSNSTTTNFGSNSLSSPFSSLSLSSSSQQPPQSNTSSSSYLSSQPTGTNSSFASTSRKPFQPTSSFGSTLFNEFSTSSSSPPPPPPPSTSSTSGLPPPVGGTSTSPTPLQPQSTGFNPFAGSRLPPLNSTLNGGTGSGSAFGAFGNGTAGGGGTGGGVATGSLI
ncbi:uncharacterized protein JCM6883_000824 [Sporobolomyces salmoneus]|uniref:uncharacterized protein n=1 Tax=Sporobolomyces salmoneus TaxID=183962 RepID=UPI00316CA807